jgi:2-methylcitrate dehydratase PrpD
VWSCVVKLASTAVVAKLYGLSARTHYGSDIKRMMGQALRTVICIAAGSRKSWATGDATSRAVRLVDNTRRGEMGARRFVCATMGGIRCAFSHTNQDLALKPEAERTFPFSAWVWPVMWWRMSYLSSAFQLNSMRKPLVVAVILSTIGHDDWLKLTNWHPQSTIRISNGAA